MRRACSFFVERFLLRQQLLTLLLDPRPVALQLGLSCLELRLPLLQLPGRFLLLVGEGLTQRLEFVLFSGQGLLRRAEFRRSALEVGSQLILFLLPRAAQLFKRFLLLLETPAGVSLRQTSAP